MFQGFTGWHALIILVVVLLLFGATKLPALAKSVGQSAKIFKSEMKSDEATPPASTPADSSAQNTVAQVAESPDKPAGTAKP